MPELGEVEYYRQVWDPGIGKRVKEVLVHSRARTFRNCRVKELKERLVGAIYRSSQAHGKRLLFRFSGNVWLGLHLGMSGKLAIGVPELVPERHEHLVLVQSRQALVLTDYRQFGEVRLHIGKSAPHWWRDLPPSLLSDEFDRDLLRRFLKRHARAPLKAVLLMQERFPGIGNWMADEILWRARIYPGCPAGRIERLKLSHLYRSVREVAGDALRVIGNDWGDPPDTWLFNHRWEDGGKCPKTGRPLVREKIGGRTTCWSPAWQKWPRVPKTN